MNIKAFVGAAAIAVAASSASAVTVGIGIQQFADVSSANAARDAFISGQNIVASESFENLGGQANPTTAVGSFVGILPTTAGASAIDCGGGIAATTCVRSGTAPNTRPFGRFATDGDRWLDSNDMTGIRWSIPGGATLSAFTHIAFFLTDVDDVGSLLFNITASNFGGVDYSVQRQGQARLPNAALHLVTMEFSEFVSMVEISMINGQNDGFGIDNVTISAVPVPASALLLLGGLGGLAAMKRRRKAA